MNEDLRKRILQKIKEAEENQLEELDLSNNYNTPDEEKITEIPEEVFKLKKLKVLKLSNNKISHLPESLGIPGETLTGHILNQAFSSQ